MAYGVIEKSTTVSKDVGTYNRSAKKAAASEDGFVYRLDSLSATSGEDQVWVATVAATGSLDDLWMQWDFGVNLTTSGDSEYRGRNDDPRNYIVASGEVFSTFKPIEGDMILMSEDAFTGAKSTNIYANSADAQVQLVWAGTQTADALSLLYRATSYISIGIGSSISNRITAYRMECVAN